MGFLKKRNAPGHFCKDCSRAKGAGPKTDTSVKERSCFSGWDMPGRIFYMSSLESKIKQVCDQFLLPGEFMGYEEVKMGNVNRTYRVRYRQPDGGEAQYMLQAVNTFVFKNPRQVMENIDRVTGHIRKKRPGQTALHFHHVADGKNYLMEEDGFWRLFNYIPSVTYNACDDLQVVRNGGAAFGAFQTLLSDFDASLLHDTIPDFHNTVKRYEKLMEDVEKDPCGKVAEAREEIDWLISVREKACRLTRLYEEGQLPLRVTHNDTKINNVLFDQKDHKALVVIDLDTVMPGLVGHDFGDAIRFAANFVEEDSPEYEKAGVNMEIFTAFAEGFLKYTATALTEKEIETLPLSCFVLAAELATRFLDDYILGSPYFKINYPEHNLVRARCQIALAQDMLRKEEEMKQAVAACAARFRG